MGKHKDRLARLLTHVLTLRLPNGASLQIARITAPGLTYERSNRFTLMSSDGRPVGNVVCSYSDLSHRLAGTAWVKAAVEPTEDRHKPAAARMRQLLAYRDSVAA